MQTGLLQKAEKWRHATNLKKKVAACSEFQTQSQDYLTIIMVLQNLMTFILNSNSLEYTYSL